MICVYYTMSCTVYIVVIAVPGASTNVINLACHSMYALLVIDCFEDAWSFSSDYEGPLAHTCCAFLQATETIILQHSEVCLPLYQQGCCESNQA